MNSNTTNSKSTRELKDQVIADIHKVNKDINEIQKRLSPGQIIDDAIFYPSAGNPSVIFDKLKRNPVGTTFLTLGTLLLMEDNEHQSYETMIRQKSGDVLDQTRQKLNSVKETISSKIPHRDRISEGVYGIDDIEASDTLMDSAKSKISDKARATDRKAKMKENLHELKSKAHDSIDRAKDKVQSAKDTAYTSVRNLDPLTYMALGAGLGTLTGAALPLTEKESLLMEDSDLGHHVSDFTRDIQEALNQSVTLMKNELLNDLSHMNINLFSGP